jgi:hypothetical protein
MAKSGIGYVTCICITVTLWNCIEEIKRGMLCFRYLNPQCIRRCDNIQNSGFLSPMDAPPVHDPYVNELSYFIKTTPKQWSETSFRQHLPNARLNGFYATLKRMEKDENLNELSMHAYSKLNTDLGLHHYFKVYGESDWSCAHFLMKTERPKEVWPWALQQRMALEPLPTATECARIRSFLNSGPVSESRSVSDISELPSTSITPSYSSARSESATTASVYDGDETRTDSDAEASTAAKRKRVDAAYAKRLVKTDYQVITQPPQFSVSPYTHP